MKTGKPKTKTRFEFESRRQRLLIDRACNDLLYDTEGGSYIDLFSGHGSVWVGHSNNSVQATISKQLQDVWTTGGLNTAVGRDAKQLIESFFPSTRYLAGIYSTGMEAAEFAIRFTRTISKKRRLIGFNKSMHGKSLGTSSLGWNNFEYDQTTEFVRLPFVDEAKESEIVQQLDSVFQRGDVAAVFVEPIQGSNSGHMASPGFYRLIYERCRKNNTLLVFDEILTGFFRTGPPFFFSDLGFTPDVILIGKSLGNGFPISAVLVPTTHQVMPHMLPGSTFSDNPLAAAAAVGTLTQVSSLDLTSLVLQIQDIIMNQLAAVHKLGVHLRGRGALWILEIPAAWNLEDLVIRIYERGVSVSFTGKQIRLIPCATITPSNLERACKIILDELHNAYAGQD